MFRRVIEAHRTAANIVGGLFAVLGGVATVIDLLGHFHLEKDANWVFLGLILLFFALGAFVLFTSRGPHQPLRYRRSVVLEDALRIRTANHANEAAIIGRLDRKQFGADSIDDGRLIAWWRAYQPGIYLFEKEGVIIGAFGLWPLNERVFSSLVNGKLEETEIEGRDIHRKPPFLYWYVADIVFEQPPPIKKGQGILLAEHALQKWLESGDAPKRERIQVCGLGFTAEGRNAMRQYGMTPNGCRSPSGHEVFYACATADEIDARVKLRQKPRR